MKKMARQAATTATTATVPANVPVETTAQTSPYTGPKMSLETIKKNYVLIEEECTIELVVLNSGEFTNEETGRKTINTRFKALSMTDAKLGKFAVDENGEVMDIKNVPFISGQTSKVWEKGTTLVCQVKYWQKTDTFYVSSAQFPEIKKVTEAEKTNAFNRFVSRIESAMPE